MLGDMDFLNGLIRSISENGILIVIAALFLCIVIHIMKKNDEIVEQILSDTKDKIDKIVDELDGIKDKQNMQFDTLKRINDHMGKSEGCMKEVKEMLKKNK